MHLEEFVLESTCNESAAASFEYKLFVSREEISELLLQLSLLVFVDWMPKKCLSISAYTETLPTAAVTVMAAQASGRRND